MSNDIEEIIDDMTMVTPHKGIIKGMTNFFVTNSTIANPIFSDYAVEKIANPIQGRYGHSSVLIGEYLYVFGGLVDNGSGTKVCTNDFYRLHIASNVWLKIDAVLNAPSPRAYFAMQRAGNLIYIHGGVNYTSAIGTGIFDNNPQVAFNLPINDTVGAIGSSYVRETQKTYHAGTYVFDIQSDKWSKLTFTNATVIPRAYASSFVYGNFFCVLNGLTSAGINQAVNGTTATPTWQAGDGFMYFNVTLTNPTWISVSTSAVNVWGHNSILIGNSVYRFFGSTVTTLASTLNIRYEDVVQYDLTITNGNLTAVVSAHAPTTKAIGSYPESFMFFSLAYFGDGFIQLMNGIQYNSSSTIMDPCYYMLTSSNSKRFLIPKNESLLMSTTFVKDKQSWSSYVSPYLTNSTMEHSISFYGTDIYIYGGRNPQYNVNTPLIKISNNVQSIIPTYLPVRASVRSNKFSINGYEFTVVHKNGKVYILIYTLSGKNLSIYSLRVTS